MSRLPDLKSRFYLSLFVVLVSQIACGPKVSDVLSKYQGDFQKKREQFKAIAQALPPTAADKPCPAMNPPLKFNENTKTYNAEMLMYEQLLNPDAKPEFDMAPQGDLLNAVQWTGPNNPLSSRVLNNPGSDMEKSLKSALEYRYLVVNRVSDLKNPVAVDEKTYSPGRANLEAFIVDLSSNQVLCSFAFQAQSASTVSYSYKTGESQQERLAEFAHSTMWEDARKKLIAKLKQIPGADVELK
jgi:hypothetical protein